MGTPSFFAREHPTPPSFRVRHTRNDSCYSNNGLLSLGDEESNVRLNNTAKQHSPPPPPRTTKHNQYIPNTAQQQFSTNSVPPSTTKLRRSTSLRQHQQPLHTNNLNKTGNHIIHQGIINNNSTTTTTTSTNKTSNCTHSQCNDTDSSFASKQVVLNRHESNNSNKSQNINNNCIIRNTKSGVNNNCLLYTSDAADE